MSDTTMLNEVPLPVPKKSWNETNIPLNSNGIAFGAILKRIAMTNPDDKDIIAGDDDLGLENLPSGEEVYKEEPDEETPTLIGQKPDVFNVPKDDKPEPIKPLKEDDLLDDDPKRGDGLL